MTLKHVSGFREADRLLRELGPTVENRVLQSATMAGARVLAKSVKANAPKGTLKQSPSSKKYGRLTNNIKTQVLRIAKKKGRRGARVSTGNAFWSQFLEFGTRRMSARPFFRPAIDQALDPALVKLREFLGRGIEREAAKLARKNGVK